MIIEDNGVLAIKTTASVRAANSGLWFLLGYFEKLLKM